MLPEAVLSRTAAVSTSPAFADRGIDEGGADRMHLDRLVAEQEEAGHVEIVDHHVPEQAARGRDVADRRRAGVARQDRDEFHLADLAIGEALAQAREVRVEAAVEADHQRRAGLLDDREAALDARRSKGRPAFRRTPPCRRARRARSGPHASWSACRSGWRRRPGAPRLPRARRSPPRSRRRVPWRRAHAGRRPPRALAFGWAAALRPWMRPMRPAPSTAILIMPRSSWKFGIDVLV